MRIGTLTGCALALAGLMIGCADNTAPGAADAFGSPQFDFMSNVKDGPVVFRWYNDYWWIITTDPSRELSAFHGWDVFDDAYCVAGGSSEADTVAVQWVENPVQAITMRAADGQYVAIYGSSDLVDIVGPGWSTYCEGITGPLLVAYGQVQFRSGDTDDQWRGTWEGTVDLIGGGQAHYIEVQHVINGRWVREEIKLMPLGK